MLKLWPTALAKLNAVPGVEAPAMVKPAAVNCALPANWVSRSIMAPVVVTGLPPAVLTCKVTGLARPPPVTTSFTVWPWVKKPAVVAAPATLVAEVPEMAVPWAAPPTLPLTALGERERGGVGKGGENG